MQVWRREEAVFPGGLLYSLPSSPELSCLFLKPHQSRMVSLGRTSVSKRGKKKKLWLMLSFFFFLSLPSFPASIHQLLQKRGRLNWKLLKIRWTSLHCTVHMFACSLTTPFPNLAAQLPERLKLRGISLTSLTAAWAWNSCYDHPNLK